LKRKEKTRDCAGKSRREVAGQKVRRRTQSFRGNPSNLKIAGCAVKRGIYCSYRYQVLELSLSLAISAIATIAAESLNVEALETFSDLR